MIDEEIIYYEYKTEDTFENCSRGFSAVTSYDEGPVRDKLSFTETTAKTHKTGATIKNLNVLFLQQFFKKLKTQIAPGFDDRTLYSELDQRNFLYGVESFYQTKGTEQSFEILFRALYGLDVEVIDPSQYLLRPSNADYKITKDFIVEKIDGDPMDLRNFTLNQEISGQEVLFPMLYRLTVKSILESISKSVLTVVFKETSVFRVQSLVSFRLNQKQ